MGQHISNSGAWVAAKEKVGLTNKTGKPLKHPITGEMIGVDEPYIYEGPDRGAMEQYSRGDITSQPFWKDTEWRNRVRQLHNLSMEEFMKEQGFDEKTSQAEFEKKLAVVNLHKPEVRKSPTKQRSGGADTTGQGESYEGNFGSIKDAKKTIK